VGQFRSGSVGLDFQKGNLRDRFPDTCFQPVQDCQPTLADLPQCAFEEAGVFSHRGAYGSFCTRAPINFSDGTTDAIPRRADILLRRNIRRHGPSSALSSCSKTHASAQVCLNIELTGGASRSSKEVSLQIPSSRKSRLAMLTQRRIIDTHFGRRTETFMVFVRRVMCDTTGRCCVIEATDALGSNRQGGRQWNGSLYSNFYGTTAIPRK
jgi:hypothetical protein